MSVVISTALTLNPVEVLDLVNGLSDYPLIGYNNVLSISNVAADYADPNNPVTNLANGATYRYWLSTSAAEQHVTVTTDGLTQIDYLAIAKHNLGSNKFPVSVEGYIGGGWIALAGPVMLPDDSPALFRWSPQAITQVRLRIQAASNGAIPRVAVMYLGKLLIMAKRLWVGFTPLPHGRKTSISNGRSESGQFLGRIQMGAWRETSATFRLLDPAWYRANLDPFLAVQATTPFFFAWRPASYPNEVGYGALKDDPAPAAEDDQTGGNLLAITLNMTGVA